MFPHTAPSSRFRQRYWVPQLALVAWWLLAGCGGVHASMFQGETLDSIANAISWAVLIIAPVVGLTVFWLVHILPEKIAHKKQHPQTAAIQCLCLLSLCFGGLLWPLAWLWAYSKPVLYKMAYGRDTDPTLAHRDAKHKGPPPESDPDLEPEAPGGSEAGSPEIDSLRQRVRELEAKLNRKGGRS